MYLYVFSFEMNATKFQNTIFIEENLSFRMSSRESRPETRQMQLGTFWGYKFETLSTLPDWWSRCTQEQIESRDEEIVSNEAQWCLIVRTGFDKTRIILGGEVDALLSGEPRSHDNPPTYVELKTSKEVRTGADAAFLDRKMLRFWAQSFLLGVSKIIIGFRDSRGTLCSLQEHSTTSLPSRAKKSGRNHWDGNTCINFTSAFLKWLQTVIVDEGVVWKISHRDGDSSVKVYQVPEQGSFLSKEFMEWRGNKGGSVADIGGNRMVDADGD